MNLKKIVSFFYSYKLKGVYRFDLDKSAQQYSESQMKTYRNLTHINND